MGDLVVDEGFAVLNDFNADAKKKSDKGHDDPIPRTKFASYIDALSVSDAHKATFLQDCSRVFTARTKEDSEGYSTGSTYFLPAVMQPRCALEELAQKIFCAHVDTLDKSLWDPERSGSEWWTLVLDSGDSNGKAPISGDDDEEEEEEEEEETVEEGEADEQEKGGRGEAEKRLSIDAAEFVPSFSPAQLEHERRESKSSLMARVESFNS
mmetsp:Transcript_4068/g.8390  ORF Transcript_4068/g.8390 Transcript_4068/m.8390 type:complete len:210 (+) Transcript_4068:161-790(+)